MNEEQKQAALKLADEMLKWWEDNRYTTIDLGDGEEDNLYNEEPLFVEMARNLKHLLS